MSKGHVGLGNLIGIERQDGFSGGIFGLRDQLFLSSQNKWAGSFYRQISFITTQLDNFQVRVVLTTSNFDYSKTLANGANIRFGATATATSFYNHWVESWNPSGTSVIWVRVPFAGTSSIFMLYAPQFTSDVSNIDNTMDEALQFMYYSGGSSGPFASLDGGGQDVGANIANYNWTGGTVSINGFGSRADNVSIRWKGWVKPSGSGNHTFYFTTDDGSRLFVGPNSTATFTGNWLINSWVDQGPTEYAGTISITDGIPRYFQYEWFETGGGAYAAVGWATPNIGKRYGINPSNLRAPKYQSNYGDSFSYAATVGTEQR